MNKYCKVQTYKHSTNITIQVWTWFFIQQMVDFWLWYLRPWWIPAPASLLEVLPLASGSVGTQKKNTCVHKKTMDNYGISHAKCRGFHVSGLGWAFGLNFRGHTHLLRNNVANFVVECIIRAQNNPLQTARKKLVDPAWISVRSKLSEEGSDAAKSKIK